MLSKIYLTLFFCFYLAISSAQIHQVPSDFNTIQSAIEAAENGDTILVAPGTYMEHLNFDGKNLVLASHYILNSDEEYIQQTIIDGMGEDAVIKFENNETSEAALIGFTITRGSHNPFEDFPEYGGGILCINASPTIKNNLITSCFGSQFNYSNFGAIYCENSSAIIEYNTIDSIVGHFTNLFGGIVSHKASPIIRWNKISNIEAGYCFFGGGISGDSSNLTIYRNIIDRCNFDVLPTTASIKLIDTEVNIFHNTLMGEIATFGPMAHTTITNNIISSPSELIAIANDLMAQPPSPDIFVEYNNVQGGWEGTGNFDEDPLFVDRDNFDYNLLIDSPCIDTGDPSMENDPDGSLPDVGALYFNQTISSTVIIDPFSNIQISPNPAKDYIQINGLTQGPVTFNYSINDLNGRIIQSGLIGFESKIQLEDIPKGAYFLNLSLDNKVHKTFKFIKI